MGLFNKKKSEKIDPEIGFVLFDEVYIDWEGFKKHLEEEWQIATEVSPTESGQLVFEIEGMMVGVGFVEVPVPHKEAERGAKLNYFWKEAIAVAEQHKAHAIVSVMRATDPIAQSILFTKVVSALLKTSHAMALYKDPTVWSSEFYITVAEDMKTGHLPLLNWIYFGIYRDGNAYSGYTYGLTAYGKEEIEVIHTSKAPSDLYDFLVDIAGYVVRENVILKDGETIGFSEDEKMTIKRSEGVAVKGESLKIDCN